MQISQILKNADECFAAGQKLGKLLQQELQPLCIMLHGDLGAGKTTLTKGAISTLAHVDPNTVLSPTFTYVQHYEHTPPISHFDLYRLQGVNDFLALGFDEILEDSIAFVEWPSRIQGLPIEINVLDFYFNHKNGTRELVLGNETWNYLKKLQA